MKTISNSSALLVNLAYKQFNTPRDFVLVGTSTIAVPFVLIRLLIPLLRKRLGNTPVDEVLNPHKVALSLFMDGYTALLSPSEKVTRELLVAQLKSNITHSTIRKLTLLDTCSKILIELMGKNDFRLVIPDVRHLDSASVDVLNHLYHNSPSAAPILVLGYDPNWGNPIFNKETAMSFYYSVDASTVLQSLVFSFETVAHIFTPETTTEQLKEYTSLSIAERLDSLDDGLELKVWDLLNITPEKMDAAAATQIFTAIRRCFRLFDYSNAMRLTLLAKPHVLPFLTTKEKATFFHIMGLSAHNRHFFSQGNTVLAGFLDRTFQQALKFETDAATRIAILYRLAVTLSRRANELDRAKNYMELAYQELAISNFDGIDKELQTAWVNNIQSFIEMRLGNLPKAVEKHESAFYLLDKVTPDTTFLQDEVDYSKAVLAENLATLYSIKGDFEQMKFWYAQEEQHNKWDDLKAVPLAEWQSFYFQNLELKQALERTTQGIIKTQKSFDYVLQYFFTLSALDINYRLGYLEEASTFLKKSLVFEQRIGYEYISKAALLLLSAKIAIKQGKLDKAIGLLQELQTENPDFTSSCLLLLAHCYAKQNKGEAAEEQINQAIQLAVETGECQALVDVTLAAGKTCQLLGRIEDAKAAYNQSFEVTQSEVDGLAFKPTPENMLELYLGWYECTANDEYLEKTIPYLAQALKKDADAWWQINRTLIHLSKLPTQKRSQLEQQQAASFKLIQKAAAQRMDSNLIAQF